MGAGRPKNHSEDETRELAEKFAKYITDTDIPIIAEFAYQNDVMRQSLYDYPEFSTLLKKCIDKKEAQLERKGLDNKVNPTIAIFSLKQLGWRDKPEQDTDLSLEEIQALKGIAQSQMSANI